MALLTIDKTAFYDWLDYDPGVIYTDSTMTGDVDCRHFNDETFNVNSEARFYIKVLNSQGGEEKSVDFNPKLGKTMVPEETWNDLDFAWSVSLAGIPPGTGYKIKLVKYDDAEIYIEGNSFSIVDPLSSEKAILDFYFRKEDNESVWPNGIGDRIYSILDPVTLQVTFNYPSTMDVTALVPVIEISDGASILPLASSPQDFTSEVNYTVTAEDSSDNVWDVNGTGVGEASLFIYDNIYTRAIPDKLERGDTINWYCLIANSGNIANGGTEQLTVILTDSQGGIYEVMYQAAVGAIDPYEDKEISSSYVVPDTVPLGTDIEYYVQFMLNNSLIKRYVLISNWDESSLGIVYNKPIGAFVRETFSKSKFFANINKDFYSLNIQEGSNTFYYHNDAIADGSITLYGQNFYPSVTFIVNKSKVEKIFDNMMIHLGEIGVKQIEYWTEDQYAIHEWPDVPLSQVQSRPWIDPEFREDKWYLPIHNEEIADYDYIADGDQADGPRVRVVNNIPSSMRSSGTISVAGTELDYVSIDFDLNEFILDDDRGFAITDGDPVIGIPGGNAKTREMRGTWMKVKITFNALKKFTLKNVLTEFRESNI